MFTKILVANRGEIAVRVMASCQALGITAVAVYSEADRGALHVRLADEASPIGQAPAAESYLSIPAIIGAARRAGAEAIHPGYGFLSENAEFAEACTAAGIVFIGPSPEAIRLLGSKTAAKEIAQQAGVPTIPGYAGEDQSAERFLAEARQIGFPVMLKPTDGGGGKGMRALLGEENFAEALAGAKREALGAFGSERMFLEKLIVEPRHVEFQILADAHGHTIHLGERECSIQRRHQKIVEESPSVALSPELRAEMGAAAVRVAEAAGYVNAGTVEFLLDADGRYYFLEMNTRLQVEHPVTESVTGLDLVKHQILIAAGEPLRLSQEHIAPHGHAIEMRLYAEDPANGFLPSIGQIEVFDLPRAPGVRLDSGVVSGSEVTVHYDPMLAKLIASGEDRPAALERLRWALDRWTVLGVETNLPLLRVIAAHPAFAAGRTFTDFLIKHDLSAQLERPSLPIEALLAAAALEVAAAPEQISVNERAARNTNGRPFNPWTQGGALRRGAEQTLLYTYEGQQYHLTLTPASDDVSRWAVRIVGEREGRQQGLFPEKAFLVTLARPSADEVIVQFGERRGLARVVWRGYETLVSWQGVGYRLERPRPLDVDVAAAGATASAVQQKLTAPMPGTIVKVHVREGEHVQARQTLLVLSAMKMEHAIAAPHAAIVRRLPFAEGASVPGGATLVELGEEASGGTAADVEESGAK
ncbi:MAG TPA: acetyl-CoA carboxylase biotin carboxylase subunit [Ktedonobacterales bacterium]|nr:acetyl-CoA carboxylase biotin carboxylase subunit [Ktedonobacterales bacterium]